MTPKTTVEITSSGNFISRRLAKWNCRRCWSEASGESQTSRERNFSQIQTSLWSFSLSILNIYLHPRVLYKNFIHRKRNLLKSLSFGLDFWRWSDFTEETSVNVKDVITKVFGQIVRDTLVDDFADAISFSGEHFYIFQHVLLDWLLFDPKLEWVDDAAKKFLKENVVNLECIEQPNGGLHCFYLRFLSFSIEISSDKVLHIQNVDCMLLCTFLGDIKRNCFWR